MAEDQGLRKLKLFCPSVSKMIDWVALNEQRLDFGSLAGAFGLEPWTVKLNGHFVSRGVDLVASCVTWRSLLAFFSSKGLSTGKDDGDALVVEGKLSRVGAKRTHYYEQDTNSKSLPCNDLGRVSSKKLRVKAPEECINLGLKRKQVQEERASLKKLKQDTHANSGKNSLIFSSSLVLLQKQEVEIQTALCQVL